jgi:hypothetical protein
MTGINPNSILNRHPYYRNQMGYGDAAALSLDDKTVGRVKDTIDDNVAGKLVLNSAEKAKEKGVLPWIKEHAIILGLGLATTFSLDKGLSFLAKGEDANKSYLGRFTNGIDRLSDKFKFLKFERVKKAYKNTLGKSKLISSMVDAAPEIPKFSMAKNIVAPTKNKAVKEFVEAVAKDGMPIETNAASIDKALKTHFKKLTPATRKDLGEAYKKVLKTQGKEAALQSLNTSMYTHGLDEIRDPHFIKEALEKAEKIPGQASKHIELLRNKAILQTAAKSPISKLVMAGFNTAHRFLSLGGIVEGLKGFKNLKGGKTGALAVLAAGGAALWKVGGLGFHAFMGIMPFGEMAKNTIDAPKGEKKSTAAHMLLVEFVAGWMLMDVMAGLFYKGLGSLRRAEGGNIVTKGIAKLLNLTGNIGSVGLHTKTAVSPKGKGILSHMTFPARKGFEWLKKGGGFVGRFAAVAFFVMPLASKLMAPVSHKLFGKPEALLAKEKAEEKGTSEPNQIPQNNIEELKKALAENKSGGMLTVAAKAQNNPAGAPLKFSDVNSAEIAANNLSNSKQNYTYIPSEERKQRKNMQKEEQKQANAQAALDKTDRLLDKAKGLL